MKKLFVSNIVFLLISLGLSYGQKRVMSDFLSVNESSPENGLPQILSNFIPDDSPCVIFAFSPVGCTGAIISLLPAMKDFERKNNLNIKKIFLIYHSNSKELKEYSKFIYNYWGQKGITILSTTEMSRLTQCKINPFIGATIFLFKSKEVNNLFDTMQLYTNPESFISALNQFK